MADRKGITYANTQPDLPGSDFAQRLQDIRITRLFAANSNGKQDVAPQRAPSHPHEQRDASMIEQERPHPAPRPSFDLASDVDTAAFDARWDAEQRRAAPNQSPQPQTGEQTMTDDTPRRPEETLREGTLKAAIWRNENKKGAYHSVTVARIYRDQEGNLQDTQSFRPKDLLGLSELARRAHHQAHDLERSLLKEQRREGQDQAKTRSQTQSR